MALAKIGGLIGLAKLFSVFGFIHELQFERDLRNFHKESGEVNGGFERRNRIVGPSVEKEENNVPEGKGLSQPLLIKNNLSSPVLPMDFS
jgi:hypothetical protein